MGLLDWRALMPKPLFLLCALAAVPAQAVKILPQDAAMHCRPEAPCTQPTVDGWVPPLEYADGMAFPLQDYVRGGPNGRLYLMVSDNSAYSSDECNFGPPKGALLPSVQANPCSNRTLFIGLIIPRPKDA